MHRFFIDRPVLASVLSLLIVLSGFLALKALPIAQYPEILPPEVVVSASYPGASAEIVANTVASPLEDQINGVDHMLYMRSTCTNSGSLTLTVTFEVGTNPDQAAIDVNNRVQAATSRLPAEVSRQGVVVNKRSSAILQVVALSSHDKKYDSLYLSNYALLNVVDVLKRLPGVGDASLFGAKNYSMRIWLQPDRLNCYNLTAEDVTQAISEQNFPYAGSSFGQEPTDELLAYSYSTTTFGQMLTADEFGQIVLRSDEKGSVLQLKDVARIELGAQDYSFEATYNDGPTSAIGIYLQPGANALATAERVHLAMEEIAAQFPAGLFYAVPFDTILFVQKSIHEVLITLGQALLLVIAIVYLFLQNARATLIPLIAVPVSLIGTFAGMYMLGFSINLLTLFGFVLAIGIVVDDAIIVLENVERLITKEKLSPYEAAVQSMRQVAGPVIAIVLVLCAVFIPAGFMGGLTGEMYKQFAITIAVSVIISGFVALTLTPSLCARLLHATDATKIFPFFTLFNRFFERMTSFYVKGVSFMIAHTKLGVVAFLLVLATVSALYIHIPTSLVPEEDQGIVFVLSSLLPGSSLKRTQAVTGEVAHRLAQQSEVKQVVTFSGFDLLSASQKSNAGISFVMLKDWKERTSPQSSAVAFAGKSMGINSDIKDAYVIAFCPPPIIGMNMTGGFELYLENRSGANIETIASMAGQYVKAASLRPELSGVQAMVAINTPQYDVQLDRAKAKALGIGLDSIYATMQSTFGSAYVNDFTLFGRTFRVNLQSDARFRQKPEDLQYVFVRSCTGALISLSSLITIKHKIGADLVERFNGFPAVKIIGGAAPGFSSGQALSAVEETARQTLPADYSIGWTGS